MGLIELVALYVAFVIVVFLHELGHVPKKIKWTSWFPIPSAAAMDAKWRLGGLLMNAILFYWIFTVRPDNILLQFIGAIAWIHFILYAIVGSIIPEPKSWQVNNDTFVWDDVPNEYGYLFIPGAIMLFLYMQDYFIPILKGVLIW